MQLLSAKLFSAKLLIVNSVLFPERFADLFKEPLLFCLLVQREAHAER